MHLTNLQIIIEIHLRNFGLLLAFFRLKSYSVCVSIDGYLLRILIFVAFLTIMLVKIRIPNIKLSIRLWNVAIVCKNCLVAQFLIWMVVLARIISLVLEACVISKWILLQLHPVAFSSMPIIVIILVNEVSFHEFSKQRYSKLGQAYSYNSANKYLQIQRNKSMNYILDPNLLDICSHANDKNSSAHNRDTLYYQWQAKNTKNKFMHQFNRLKVMFQEIVEYEKEKEQQIQKKRILKAKHHQRDQNKDFYDYNMQWKRKIDNQVQHQRNQLKQIRIRNEEQLMNRNISQNQRAQNTTQIYNQYVNIKARNFGKQRHHKGPILAWQQHFNDYMKAKNSQNLYYQDSSRELFHPKINKKSQKITKNFDQPVQQRLISYGQKLKIKKQQFQQELQNQHFPFKPKTLTNKPKMYKPGYENRANGNQSGLFQQNQDCDIYSRLYKQAQTFMSNRAKNEMKAASLYDFKPQVNKNTEQLQLKVKTIRQRRPLYSVKSDQQNKTQSINKQKSNNILIRIGQQTRTRSYNQMQTSASSQSFQNFLKRNQELLKKKKKLQQQKIDLVKKADDQVDKKCTFSPSLNAKSVKIFQSRLKQQQQYQISRMIKFDSEADTKIQTDRLRISKPVQSSVKMYQQSFSEDQIVKENTRNQMPNDSLNQQSSISETGENSHAYFEQNKRSQYKQGNSFDRQRRFSKLRQQSSYFGETIGELNEEDSIQKIKQSEWQSQIKNVESKIEQMMKRVLR